MANRIVFCNTPWYEAQIYWDGSLGVCCQETGRVYDDTVYNRQKYNIKNISLKKWINSEPVKKFRLDMLGNKRITACNRCYTEERHSGSSRRHRANQKSVIFTKSAFEQSFNQSPGYEHFQHSLAHEGHTNTFPIDLHIDLGNYCNLACKMCAPQASTKIATQMVKWHCADAEDFLGVDWTKDDQIWQRFLNDVIEIPNLKNIHLMGGETVLQPRFKQMLDWFILHERYDVSWSFVTNGTHYDEAIVEKLGKFARVGIEVSIETVSPRNAYVRQGTDSVAVLTNLLKYKQACANNNMTVTVRPAISLLTIGHYYTLLDYCLANKLLVKSLLVTEPAFLDVRILPDDIRQQYLATLTMIEQRLDYVCTAMDYNESDPNMYQKSIKVQLDQTRALLIAPRLADADSLLEAMVRHCERWDEVYGYNALKFYPEFEQIWTKYGYRENLRRNS